MLHDPRETGTSSSSHGSIAAESTTTNFRQPESNLTTGQFHNDNEAAEGSASTSQESQAKSSRTPTASLKNWCLKHLIQHLRNSNIKQDGT